MRIPWPIRRLTKGWSQVYKVSTYATDLEAAHERIVHNFKKLMSGHSLIWTELRVGELEWKGMRFEIDVEAYDRKQANFVGAAQGFCIRPDLLEERTA